MSVCRLSRFENENFLSSITCLQITHDAVYFTYKPSHTGSSLDPAHHVHAQGVGDQDPLDVEAMLDGVHEDVFVDAWEDESSEDEEMEMGPEDDDGQCLRNLLSLVSTYGVHRS